MLIEHISGLCSIYHKTMDEMNLVYRRVPLTTAQHTQAVAEMKKHSDDFALNRAEAIKKSHALAKATTKKDTKKKIKKEESSSEDSDV